MIIVIVLYVLCSNKVIVIVGMTYGHNYMVYGHNECKLWSQWV